MAAHRGYMLIADLSGYTAYLTSTELEHANGVLSALLEVLVARLEEPFQPWRLEGDAVLAYTKDEHFPSGDTFLTFCEEMYNAFATRRLDIQANTTCPCRACRKVPELDLKILAHHGPFQEVQIGPMKDISGPAAILVHRMTKTGVANATGAGSYALFTDAAWQAMDAPGGLVPYQETFEHFGDVQMQVYDLGAAWTRIRENRERTFVEETDGMLTLRVHLPVPRPVAWQILHSPKAKKMWMGLRRVNLTAHEGRPGPGAHYHCIHNVAEFHSWVVDWEPFHYASNRYQSCFDPHLSHFETYELTDASGGTDLRYTAARLFDPKDPETPQREADDRLLELYVPALTGMLQGLAAGTAEDPTRYAG